MSDGMYPTITAEMRAGGAYAHSALALEEAKAAAG